MDFSKIIAFSVMSSIFEKFMKPQSELKLPKFLGNFVYEKEFVKKTEVKPFYKYAIYKNPDGVRAIAKMWQGKFHNFSYFTLKNEEQTYRLLWKVYSRIKSRLPNGIKNIRIPRFLGSFEQDSNYILLIEFIAGFGASNKNDNDKIVLLNKIIKFLITLGNKANSSERKYISRRVPLHFIILYPFTLFVAMRNYPKARIILLKCSKLFFLGVNRILREKRMVFSHRDLAFKNILYNKKELILIDLEYCIYTIPQYELANTFHNYWDDTVFYRKLFKDIKNNSSFHEFEIFKWLVIVTTTHTLVEKSYRDNRVVKYVDLLNYIYTLNNEK